MAKLELTLPDNAEDLFFIHNGRKLHQVIFEHSKHLNALYKDSKNPIYLHLNSEIKALYQAVIGVKLDERK